jgi:hypothetical protein
MKKISVLLFMIIVMLIAVKVNANEETNIQKIQSHILKGIIGSIFQGEPRSIGRIGLKSIDVNKFLRSGNYWEYSSPYGAYRETVLSETTNINGYPAKIIEVTGGRMNETRYYYRDSDGALLRTFSPYIDGVRNMAINFTPPVENGLSVSESSISGTLTFSASGYATQSGTFSFVSSKILNETVTVPAGTFLTNKMRHTLSMSMYGLVESQTGYSWINESVGIVKVSIDGEEAHILTSTNLHTIDLSPLGNVDGYMSTSIQGWAYDPNDTSLSVEIHIYVDGQITGIEAADNHRPDLAALGLENNNHGFNYQLPDTLADGEHTIEVYAINVAQGNNKKIGSAETTVTSVQPMLDLQTSIYTGQATYSATSTVLSVPAIDVPTALGTAIYTCDMTLVPFSDPMQFQVNDGSLLVTTVGNEVNHATYFNGSLLIPAVEIEGNVSQMDMRLINDNPITFQVIDISIIE